MGTAIKHPVPDRVKPSFVIFDIRALWRSGLIAAIVMPWIARDGGPWLISYAVVCRACREGKVPAGRHWRMSTRNNSTSSSKDTSTNVICWKISGSYTTSPFSHWPTPYSFLNQLNERCPDITPPPGHNPLGQSLFCWIILCMAVMTLWVLSCLVWKGRLTWVDYVRES